MIRAACRGSLHLPIPYPRRLLAGFPAQPALGALQARVGCGHRCLGRPEGASLAGGCKTKSCEEGRAGQGVWAQRKSLLGRAEKREKDGDPKQG